MITTIVALLALIALAVLLLILVVTAGYLTAAKNKHATFVKEGTMKFKKYGENYETTLANIAGYYFNKGRTTFTIQVGKELPITQKRDSYIPIHDEAGKVLYKLPKVATEPSEIDVVQAILPLLTDEELKLSEGKQARRKLKRKSDEGWFQRQNYLSMLKGFYWVSIAVPYGRLHLMEFTRIKLKEYSLQTVKEGMDIKDIVEEEPPLKADYLLWQFPRPIIVREVEFRDFQTADIVLGTLLQVVMPYRPVFAYQGNFFPLISSAVQSAVVDYCRGYTLQEFIQYFRTGYATAKESKPNESREDTESKPNESREDTESKPNESRENKVTDFFLRAISHINKHSTKPPHGVIEEYGIWVRNAWIAAIIPTTVSKEAKDALVAKSIAEMRGKAGIRAAELGAEAARQEATGKRDAWRTGSDGEAERIQKLLVACGGSVDALNQYLKIEQRKATPGLGTLVEKDVKTGVVITVPASVTPPKS